MKMIGTLIFMLAAFGSFSAVHAEQFGTAEEARAMLDRAVAALNSNRTRALSEFNDTKNTQFHDRDLYISCYNMVDGKFTAFPSRAIIGADIREMKLQNDPVGQRAYDAIKGSPEGSIATMEYNFPKPRTDKPVLKESHRGAHRQSGLRRELLQIASKERSAKNINDDASSIVEYKQTNWPTFDANAHSYPRIPTDHTLQTGPHSPAP